MPFQTSYSSREQAQAEAIADQMVLRGIGGSTESLYSRVQNAPDLARTFTYDGAGTADERVTSIVSSSTSVGARFTDTYTYGGAPGAYRVTGMTRVQS